jgi:glycosyltransferase involved in cell wall biosynthesis
VPGQRYRFEQWQPHLEAAGIRTEVRELLTSAEQDTLHSWRSPRAKAVVVARSLMRALATLPECRRYDVVWIYRTLLVAGPPWVEKLLARRAPPIVYEFDDAIWLTKTFDANRAFSFLKFSGKTADICRLASAVIVSNDSLASYARGFNDDVTVVSSTVDVERYTPIVRKLGGPLVLGFSGSPTTIEYMSLVAGPIRRVAEQHPLQLRVMGAEFELPGVDLTVSRWTPERELDELRSYDVGLMPLADDPWTRGKGAMKALLYMSVGVPVVASPVGVTTDVIQHDVNGLLCRTEDDWVEALGRLATDPELRRRLGRAGRETVEKRFSPAAQVPRVVSVLQRAASRGSRG